MVITSEQCLFYRPHITHSGGEEFAEVRRIYRVGYAEDYVLRELIFGEGYLGPTPSGHVKQILVDGEVVYKEDVKKTTGETMELGWRRRVNVTRQVKGKASVEIALRVTSEKADSNHEVMVWWGEVKTTKGLKPAEGSTWVPNTRGGWQIKRRDEFKLDSVSSEQIRRFLHRTEHQKSSK